jgi:transcriptional regulator with XRE-family HTH domain
MPVNERLRQAMLRRGLDLESLAAHIGTSTKSVERWITGKGVPYPRTRYAVAAALGQDVGYLWPETVDPGALAGAELLATYARRADVPVRLWTDLLRAAERDVDVLAFAGMFLAEDHPDWLPLLRERTEAGTRVRILIGDPDGRELAHRDREHRIGGGVAGRVAAVMAHYEPLAQFAEIRLHDTPLYNSIYRFDDDMLVNVHVYGILAAYTPVMRLRRIDGSFFNTYIESYERVWASARPYAPAAVPA